MRIEVHQLPPASASPNSRVYLRTRYEDNFEYAKAVYCECVQVRNSLMSGGDFKPFRRPVLQLTFVFPVRRTRDEDNLRSRFKVGQDKLVAAGLIEQDDMAHLVVNRPKILVDPARAPMTIIELSERK